MSSCLSGGRPYGGFDIENIMKCQSTTSSRNSHSSSSPSSTLSESSNSPITISNRKPRTPRKRPNQTYNEAAVLLSIACPKVFSTKNLTKKNHNNNKLSKFTRQCSIGTNSIHESSELLIENSGFLFHEPSIEKQQKEQPNSLLESKVSNSCQSSPDGIEFRSSNSMELCDDGFGDDFDTESMLDEEMEEGIDSIMGNSNSNSNIENYDKYSNTCYGYPMGLGFGGNLEFNFGFGMRNGVRALKNVDDGHWWNFPVVNVTPEVVAPAVVPVKVKKSPMEKKKKKVEELMKRSEPELELESELGEEGNCVPEIIATNKLLLKLNYDDVLNAWSDKGSPLPEEISGSESPGGDIHTRLAQIDLFSENGGLREASVMRYKEKKRTRLFSKKIRYQVRKVNADRRPRSKGRFVRRPNSPTCDDT